MKIKTPWWLKYRKQSYKKRNHLTMEMILRKSFMETLKEYLNTCSVGGITQIRNSNNSRIQRLFWTVVFFVALTTVCMFLRSTWVTTFSKPLIVTSESVVYPINKIDFPAVALCNFNRISHKALVEHANKMLPFHKNITLLDLEQLFKDLGRLINYSYDESLQRRVNSLPLKPSNLSVTYIMRELAPSCEDMLIKCKWAGQDVNCTDIFLTRRTGMGHCCTFNYVLELKSAGSPSGITAPVRKQEVPGSNNGLMVIADPLIEDYEYRLGNRNGFQILIYDPRQFPDLAGGRVLYRITQPGYADFLQIDSIKQYATREVRKYPYKTRQCLFHNELKSSFRNMYSYSACLVKCRIDSIRSLCKCIPYFYPSGIFSNENLCTLRHLRCLNKYKEKLLYFFPKDTPNTTGLEVELVDSLFCPDCLPDCELTQHFVRNSKVSLSRITRTGFQNNFLMGVNLTNKCILYVYRSAPVGALHRLDVVSYWFEILSNIGGFAGMIMGIGCFTFVEILYYLMIRLVRKIYINCNQYH